jgi:hypothetical protein
MHVLRSGFLRDENKGGSLKRSLGMVSPAFTSPKAFGFGAATQLLTINLQM